MSPSMDAHGRAGLLTWSDWQVVLNASDQALMIQLMRELHGEPARQL